MKSVKTFQLSILLFVIVGVYGCGPLLDKPPDNTPPTELELYGNENTITIIVDDQPVVFDANGKFTHLSYPGTDEIPAYSILKFGGGAGNTGITIKIYQDGDLVTTGGYDGASSVFSLDGSVILDFTLEGERYYSTVYGDGAGGTKIYYNSFVTLIDLKLQSYNQPPGEKAVQGVQGTFRGLLKPFNDPTTGKQIIINGKINFKAPS